MLRAKCVTSDSRRACVSSQFTKTTKRVTALPKADQAPCSLPLDLSILRLCTLDPHSGVLPC
jgi:hypothetical protein